MSKIYILYVIQGSGRLKVLIEKEIFSYALYEETPLWKTQTWLSESSISDGERKRGRHAVGQTGQLSRGSVCSLLAAYIDTHPSDQTSHQHWLGGWISIYIYTQIQWEQDPGLEERRKTRKDKNQWFSPTYLPGLSHIVKIRRDKTGHGNVM